MLVLQNWQTVCSIDSGLKNFCKYILVILLAFSGFGFQQQSDPVAKSKAIFIYNFTRYFEWPENMKSGNFIIHVIGSNSNITQELNKMAGLKQIGNQKLEIKNSGGIDMSIKPHIIYILNDASDVLKEVASKFKGKGALIVTEKNGLCKLESALNFVAVDNKAKFEYNKGNAISAGLKTRDELKNLAVAVY